MPIAPPSPWTRHDLARDLPTRTLRSQLAVVRTLVDELERRTAYPGRQHDAQLVEELAALACRTLEAAAQMAAVIETAEESGIHARTELGDPRPGLQKATPRHVVTLCEVHE
jgi:hypothetical protein